MNDEIKRILKMVEEGKMTSEQAEKLIDAVKGNEIEKIESLEVQNSGKSLKVLINSRRGDSLNFKIPLRFAKGIIKATGKLPIKIEGKEDFDITPAIEAIQNETPGLIYEAKSHKGDTFEMVIE